MFFVGLASEKENGRENKVLLLTIYQSLLLLLLAGSGMIAMQQTCCRVLRLDRELEDPRGDTEGREERTYRIVVLVRLFVSDGGDAKRGT